MDLKKEILDAIEIIVENKLKEIKFDKTVVGVVTNKLDNNYYLINVYGSNYKIKYEKEELKIYDNVYLLIPNNNYKNIFILSKIN